MGSLLIVIAVTALVVVWVRGTRRNRVLWLNKLDLPGIWEREGDYWGRLELSGGLEHGDYRIADGEGAPERTGHWRLEGHILKLSTGNGEQDYDLRLFQEGKIGVDGPGLERRIYQKVPSNVVPLRGNSGS